MGFIKSSVLVLTFVFLAPQIERGAGLTQRLAYPYDKYPTIEEDDNGYYYLAQGANPADCPEGNLDRCYVPEYPWVVNSLTYIFKSNINFKCVTDAIDTPNYQSYFDFSSLSSIKSEIEDKWGIDKNSRRYSEAEVLGRYWRQLGRCSTFFKGIDNGFKFYQKSLELFDKYNMETILRQSNITPGKNYTYQELSDAVSKGISGKHVKISCMTSKNDEPGKQILREIGFYMDQNFKPTDPTDIESPFDGFFTCNREKVIFYRGLMDYVDEERQFRKSIRIVY